MSSTFTFILKDSSFRHELYIKQDEYKKKVNCLLINHTFKVSNNFEIKKSLKLTLKI